MESSVIIKPLANAFLPFAMSKIKNIKTIRAFKDRWIKDNYAQKINLMFMAGIDDAKALLDIPDEVIKELLDDPINRQEIFRWIIEGINDDDFVKEHFFLDPYLERYPAHQDKFVPFFQLILIKINEYKEVHWDPEFLNILHGIDIIREDLKALHSSINHLEKQQDIKLSQVQENINSTIITAIGPVGFEDLKLLLDEEKTVSARKRAEERLKHAHLDEERLELNLVITNSYLTSNLLEQAVPFLYAATTFFQSDTKKNQINILIKIIEKKFDAALELLNKNIEIEGKTDKNIELLLNIHFLQKNYEACHLVLQEYGIEGVKEVGARILLSTNKYEQVIELANKELEVSSTSKEWMLLKAEAIVLKAEYERALGISVNHQDIFQVVQPMLESIEKDNENDRHNTMVMELYAAIYFRTKQYKEAAFYYEKVLSANNLMILVFCYYLCDDWEKAINLLNDAIPSNQTLDHITFLARIYMDSGNPKDAFNILNEYEHLTTSNNQSLYYHYTKLETYYRLFKYKDIIAYLHRLEQKGENAEIDAVKGFHAILRDEWESAIHHLEKAKEHFVEQDLLDIKTKLVIAYRNQRTETAYLKIIELISTIPNWQDHDLFVNPYVQALFETNQYEEILTLFYNDFESPTIFFEEIVAAIYYLTDWLEIAKELFETLYHKTENLNFLFKYASCLYQLGQTEECLQTLQMAETKVKEDISVDHLQLLVHSYLDALQFDKALEYAYLTFQYAEKNPSAWRLYFEQFTQISVSIKDPKQEYVDAFHKVMSNFHDTFPNEPILFEQYEVFEEKQNEEMEEKQISKEFIERLKSIQDFQEEIEQVYLNYKLPISTFVELSKKEPYSTWVHILSYEKFPVWVHNDGSLKEISNGILNVATSNNVYCDLNVIFVLEYLDILNIVSKELNIYISQKQFSEFYYEFSKMKISASEGLKSIAYQDGGIRLQEWSPKEVQTSLEKLENIIAWLNKNTRKVGKGILQPRNNRETLLFEDQLQLCKDSYFSLMVDNFSIIETARNQHNCKAFTVVDLVNYLLNKKSIEGETYNLLIGKLIIVGYRYIFPKSDVFIYFLKENNLNIEGEVKWLFQFLREKEVKREYVLSMVFQVLKWYTSLYEKANPELIRFLCEVLVNEESKNKWLDRLLQLCRKNFKEEIYNELEKIVK
jgi:hypothetical protein